MSCNAKTALLALRRGHVRWEQLHPRVRAALERAGYAPLDNAALIEPMTLEEWYR